MQEVEDGLAHVALLQDFAAVLVDLVALVVEHVVELERALAHVEVARLDLDLRLCDRARDHSRLDGCLVVHAHLPEEPGDSLGGEDADQVILERVEEARRSRIALAAGATAELVVDATRLVALGADNVKTAEVDDALAEQDVDTATGHVRREGDRAPLPGLGDDERLALVVLRVQDFVLDAVPAQLVRQLLALLDRGGANEHWLAALIALLDIGDDRVPLPLLGGVDEVGIVLPDHRSMRGDLRDLELVDLEELFGLGRSGTGHARELLVHPEVVLDRDRREGPRLALDLDRFLRLDRLVQAVAPAAAGHQAAGELVDDDDLTVLDHVFLVAVVHGMRLQRVVHEVHRRDVALVHVVYPEHLLGLRDALLGQRHGVLLFLEEVVRLGPQLLRHRREAVVLLGDILRWRADDERRSRLIDEDRVGLVDDRVIQVALHHAGEVVDHVVAQVIEAELAVLAIGDVGEIRLASRHVAPVAVTLVHRLEHDARVVDRRLLVRDVRHGHAEQVVDRRHPAGTGLREVVVRCDEVRTLSRERVQVQRG